MKFTMRQASNVARNGRGRKHVAFWWGSHKGDIVIGGVVILKYVRFEDFTAVAMKNGVFWDVTPCGSCKNRRFGGT
jgi:hypothetical protein